MAKYLPVLRTLLLVCLAWIPAASSAATQQSSAEEPLPDPLTLEYALSLAGKSGAEMTQADAGRTLAQAESAISQAEDGFNLSIEGYARYIEPAETAYDQSNYDEKLGLVLRKNLIDFGRTDATQAAAAASIQGAEWRYQDAFSQQRIAVMAAYFDVLRADLAFARDNEAMAVAYVSLDKLRDRHELGQVSDIDLLEMESNYQTARRQQALSASKQRLTRSRLAIALDRPGMLPANLARPVLANLKRPLPDYDALLDLAVKENPVIKALHAEIDAAQQRQRAAAAQGRPRIDAEVEAAQYSRDMGSGDPLRAGVVFSMPLYTGGAVSARVAKQQAETYRLQGKLREAENDVRQSLLELWLNLDTLRVKREENRAQQDYRDLYLDRSRASYEMEVQTDLGDAMVRLTEAELATLDTDLSIELLWARIDALVGGKSAELSMQQTDSEASGS